ncbi:MAG: DUF815 domain-containing protein [bacterium]|nr:DUF815 domain-containing protein [bacterium]
MNVNQSWDQASIDQAFEGLLDYLGQLLDRAGVLGLPACLEPGDPLLLFLDFAQALEEELLLQWKTKTRQGMDALLLRQSAFLSDQLRQPRGLFAQWARLRGQILNAAPPLTGDAWPDFLTDRAADQRFYAQLNLSGSERLPVYELIWCAAQRHPKDLFLGLLNLCELALNQQGLGPRPEPAGLKRAVAAGDALALKALDGLLESTDAQQLGLRLEAFWQNHSGGPFSRHRAFLYRQDTKGRWALQGEAPKKKIDFAALFGIDRAAERLRQEAERFLAGAPCAHVLLWGARGMGKSSCALALLAEYAERGLRLIEVAQKDVAALPHLFSRIQGAPERFVVFLDDFGFEPHNPEFKALKSAFEGSLQQLPENLWLLATSNKKDLVQAGQLDHQLPEQRQLEDEVRALGDRFGLKLHFDRPVFEELRGLFDFLAGRYGLGERTQELWPEFLRFAGLYDHDKPSGRTVEQFLARAR